MAGPAHTRGDNFIFVEEDGVLFTGDVVINRFFPVFPDADASGKNWLAILDQLDELHPRTIVPGHGEVGGASLIGTSVLTSRPYNPASWNSRLRESLLKNQRSCCPQNFERNILTGITPVGSQTLSGDFTQNQTDFGVSVEQASVC